MCEIRMRLKYVSVVHATGRGVANRWRSQYEEDGKWKKTRSGDSKDTYEKLCALGINPDIDKVAEIIGNKGWSYIRCEGCGAEVDKAVSLGEYEAKNYCKACIEEAQIILKS